MKYLWEHPVRLVNTKLEAAIGSEPRTPLDEAVKTTLVAIGCVQLPAASMPQTQNLAIA